MLWSTSSRLSETVDKKEPGYCEERYLVGLCKDGCESKNLKQSDDMEVRQKL